MSCTCPGSQAIIPTSAYSLSLTLAAGVGFHDTDSIAIGEDMHMYIKCQFATQGHLISKVIYSPASQLNVVGEAGPGALSGYWNGHVARYKQALRHMWGSRALAPDSRRHLGTLCYGMLTHLRNS
jgi:hypothetical protein